MNTPPILSAQEWEAARQQLLVKEKALTRARDAMAAERVGCHGWPSRRNMCSRGPSGRLADRLGSPAFRLTFDGRCNRARLVTPGVPTCCVTSVS
jgi:Bacterial protein of unknown function (DUF899)